ncbi:MAG: AEC family transporter [Eubacteriales bacterium]|nr:AEC family transporter [Eubacteriales bacterium]
MSSMMFALNGVFPLFAAMSLGYLARRLKMADRETFVQLNKLIFQIFLPLLIYVNIYRSSILTVRLGGPILYAIGAILVIFGLSWLVISRTEPERRRRGVLIQAMFRSNYVLFGVPLANALLPEGGSGLTEVLIAIVIPLFNLMAVFILQFYRKEGRISPRILFKGIVTNPLIIASVLGLATLLAGIRWPVLLENTMAGLSAVATPIALFALGGQFFFSETRTYLFQLIAGVSARLMLVPLLALGGAILLGLRGEVLVSYLALFGGPVAVSSYTMTQQMNAEHELAGQILVYTSIFCVLTLFIWITVLRGFALI